MSQFAEQYAIPIEGQLGTTFPRQNDFKETFFLRWGKIRFDVHWGQELNVKVLLKVYRSDGVVERFVVDTEPRNVTWNYHQRVTRDFFVHPFPKGLGRVTAVKFAYIVHLNERSISSEHEYIWMDGHHFDDDSHQRRGLNTEHVTPNTWRTVEADAGMLQRDVDWINGHFDSLNLVPKFTKGVPYHPYHPKRYIHDQIDAVIRKRWAQPDRMHTIKVCVDCIDDTDFTNHLLHAVANGVLVQVQVDWRKMTLTNSPNYLNLKRSGIELVGVFCTPKHPKIEVAPDMHNKFIILLHDQQPVSVWTGSTNFSEGGIFGHSNVGHEVRDSGVAARYLRYWELLKGDPDSKALRPEIGGLTPTPGPGSAGGNATPKPGTGSTPTVSSTSRTPTATATSSTKSSGLGSSSTLLIVGGIAVVAIIGGIVYMSSRGNDERETMVVGGELPSGRMVTSQMGNAPRVNPTFPGFGGPPEDDFREAETTDFREAETRAATVPPGFAGAAVGGMPGQSMLTVAVSGESPQQWPLGVDQIIGRSEGPGIIVVVDKQVSRRHARISWENGHFVYRDLGPLNPTRRDGRTLPNPYILRDGDHLKVGTSELVFRA